MISSTVYDDNQMRLFQPNNLPELFLNELELDSKWQWVFFIRQLNPDHQLWVNYWITSVTEE